MNATRDCLPTTMPRGMFQETARREFEDVSGRPLFQWAWVINTCETTQCMNAQHMVTVAPTKIDYPPGICVYCGMPAGTRDHLIPRGKSGEARRHFVATVPACSDCNNRINDFPDPCIGARRRIAHERLRKSKRKTLELPDRTPREIAAFGPTLRSYIQAKAREKAALLARLGWPEDPFYDMRAFQKSGIDDPLVLGMIDDPNRDPDAQTDSAAPNEEDQ